MVVGEFSKEFDVDVKNSNFDLEKDCVLFLNLIFVIGSKNCLFFMVVICVFYFEVEFMRLVVFFFFDRIIFFVMFN